MQEQLAWADGLFAVGSRVTATSFLLALESVAIGAANATSFVLQANSVREESCTGGSFKNIPPVLPNGPGVHLLLPTLSCYSEEKEALVYCFRKKMCNDRCAVQFKPQMFGKLLLSRAVATGQVRLRKRNIFLWSSCITLQCLPVATHQQCCAITRKCPAGAAQSSRTTEHDCQWHPPGPLPAAAPRELLAIAEAETECALPDS